MKIMTERLPLRDLSIADAQYEGFGGAITSSETRTNITQQGREKVTRSRMQREPGMATNHAMYDQFDLIASERMAAGE